MMTFDSLHTWEDSEGQYVNMEATSILSMYLLNELGVTSFQCLDLENEDHDIQINKDMDLS